MYGKRKWVWKLKKKGRFCRAVASFRAVFFELLCPSGSSCSLASDRSQAGHILHRRGGGSSTGSLWQPKKQKTSSPQRSKAAQAGARLWGWGQGRGGCAAQSCCGLFSKGNPKFTLCTAPCWLLHWLFISSCFEAAESMTDWERESHLFLAAECMKFSSHPIIWKKGMWRG